MGKEVDLVTDLYYKVKLRVFAIILARIIYIGKSKWNIFRMRRLWHLEYQKYLFKYYQLNTCTDHWKILLCLLYSNCLTANELAIVLAKIYHREIPFSANKWKLAKSSLPYSSCFKTFIINQITNTNALSRVRGLSFKYLSSTIDVWWSGAPSGSFQWIFVQILRIILVVKKIKSFLRQNVSSNCLNTGKRFLFVFEGTNMSLKMRKIASWNFSKANNI